jgi:hypothetical protein
MSDQGPNLKIRAFRLFTKELANAGNKVIAAILTVAYNSAFVRDSVDAETVVHTYETFRRLLQQKDEKEAEESIPEAMKPLLEQVKKNQGCPTNSQQGQLATRQGG